MLIQEALKAQMSQKVKQREEKEQLEGMPLMELLRLAGAESQQEKQVTVRATRPSQLCPSCLCSAFVNTRFYSTRVEHLSTLFLSNCDASDGLQIFPVRLLV